MSERQFQFEWDETKADVNVRKHGVSFGLRARFSMIRGSLPWPMSSSQIEERWFSIGCASSGAMLSVVYPWSEAGPSTTKIRLISGRKATPSEIRRYQESL